VLSNENPLH
jgi:aminopeptidase N